MTAALAVCWLFHRPTAGHPPVGAGGGLPGTAVARLGAGLAQAAMAIPPAPTSATATKLIRMATSRLATPAMALPLIVTSLGGCTAGAGGRVRTWWSPWWVWAHPRSASMGDLRSGRLAAEDLLGFLRFGLARVGLGVVGWGRLHR